MLCETLLPIFNLPGACHHPALNWTWPCHTMPLYPIMKFNDATVVGVCVPGSRSHSPCRTASTLHSALAAGSAAACNVHRVNPTHAQLSRVLHKAVSQNEAWPPRKHEQTLQGPAFWAKTLKAWKKKVRDCSPWGTLQEVHAFMHTALVGRQAENGQCPQLKQELRHSTLPMARTFDKLSTHV